MLTLDRHCFNKLCTYLHKISVIQEFLENLLFWGQISHFLATLVVEQLLIFSDVTENSSFVIQTSAARTVYDAKFYIFYRSSLQDLQEGQHIIIVHGCCYYNSATA